MQNFLYNKQKLEAGSKNNCYPVNLVNPVLIKSFLRYKPRRQWFE